MKLPVGIQSFEKIREENFYYVDKTKYIYELSQNNVPYFLSRPRRFGKSLLLSTMKAFFEGRKELFKGLEIENFIKNSGSPWVKYPVLYFDFNGQNYLEKDALPKTLDAQLLKYETIYGIADNDSVSIASSNSDLGPRFQKLIVNAYEKTGLRCVVLVDEYDKPLLDAMDNEPLEAYNAAVFKGFFSTLKGLDDYIHFVFITGVTKFEKVSIFSDLNQLRDISLSKDYSDICGITKKELEYIFHKEIDTLSDSLNISNNNCIDRLEKMYDGYLFHPQGEHVFNPFSILNAFADKEFKPYWFATATPTFLIKQLKKNTFDLRKLDNDTIYANETSLLDYRLSNLDVVPLLFQTGYLTLTEYDAKRRRYTLAFPNNEVKYGFLESLVPTYTPTMLTGNGLDIYTLDEYFEKGDYESAISILKSVFAGIPYASQAEIFEYNFQSVIFIIFELLGRFVECETHTFKGRIDCLVKYPNYIYVFEFKVDDSAENALKQINDKEYSLSYEADSRKIYKIGINFDSKKRILSDYCVQ